MALYQNIVYGYKTNYERFKEIAGNYTDDEYDQLLAENRGDRTGWILLESNEAIYGKIILEGESVGQGSYLAGAKGIVELPKVQKSWQLDAAINEVIPEATTQEIKTYVVGEWI